MTTITTKSPSQQLREMAAQSSRQIRVGILIFPNVEVLDFCDPFEVLSVCRQGDLHQDDNVTQSPFVVQLIAATASMDPVTTVGGMQVVPHTTMEAIMKEDTGLDILIVPGGMGTRAIRQDTNVLDFVRHQAGKVHLGQCMYGCHGLGASWTRCGIEWDYRCYPLAKPRHSAGVVSAFELGQGAFRYQEHGRIVVYLGWNLGRHGHVLSSHQGYLWRGNGPKYGQAHGVQLSRKLSTTCRILKSSH